jgi:hypothetical protein
MLTVHDGRSNNTFHLPSNGQSYNCTEGRPGIERTVRWSNFDRLDTKMGVFLQSSEATPCGHVLKKKLTPRKPPCGHHVNGRHDHGSPVKNR